MTAISLRRVHSAFRLWILFDNGNIELLGAAGDVSERRDASRPALRRSLGFFHAPRAVALILEVSDSWTNRGGPWQAPVLGSRDGILEQETKSISREYWMIGFYIRHGNLPPGSFCDSPHCFFNLLPGIGMLVHSSLQFRVGRFFLHRKPRVHVWNRLEVALFHLSHPEPYDCLLCDKDSWALLLASLAACLFLV